MSQRLTRTLYITGASMLVIILSSCQLQQSKKATKPAVEEQRETSPASKKTITDNSVIEVHSVNNQQKDNKPTNLETPTKTPQAVEKTAAPLTAPKTDSKQKIPPPEISKKPKDYVSTLDYSLLDQNNSKFEQDRVKSFCKEFSEKLRTVKYSGCMQLGLKYEHSFESVNNRILPYRHYIPNKVEAKSSSENGRILFISGIHGDEYSAISITYLWMLNMMKYQDKNQQHWLFLPLSNPDGLFRNPATRINANNVDLNRNFPSPDWDELAISYWKKHYKMNKRRYPGTSASSEPETKWMVQLIEQFKPDAIISVHAPYGLVDYDGPDHAVPNRIGALKHRELGTYPGSLGRYAGEYLNIPVLTLELRAAGSMPSEKEIYNMWRDVEEWTMTKIRGENPGSFPRFKKES